MKPHALDPSGRWTDAGGFHAKTPSSRRGMGPSVFSVNPVSSVVGSAEVIRSLSPEYIYPGGVAEGSQTPPG